MSKEGFLKDEENKKNLEGKKKVEAKKSQEVVETIEKKRRRKIETEENLSHLKEMIEDGKMDQKSKNFVRDVSEDGLVDSEEVREILTKIDEIHNNKNIARYLPEELRITKDEYLSALKNEADREKALQKLDDALTLLASQVGGGKTFGFNIFASLTLLLDKNLVLVQENHIDIKYSLKK